MKPQWPIKLKSGKLADPSSYEEGYEQGVADAGGRDSVPDRIAEMESEIVRLQVDYALLSDDYRELRDQPAPVPEDIATTLRSGLHAYEAMFGQDAYSPMWDAVARARSWLDDHSANTGEGGRDGGG